MIKVDNIEVFNFEGAIRGLRNPMNSWGKSDSYHGCNTSRIGENDLSLMQRLYSAGTEHRKYLRQIMVSMDITAPLYWWKEADTYKVGTTSNSCSTMHKIHAKEFSLDDFSHDHLSENPIADSFQIKSPLDILYSTIDMLNILRKKYVETKDKEVWYQMIQLLPSSYNQKRTVTMNYENVMNMINQRENHKLDEWQDFVKTLKKLPFVEDIRGGI